MFKVLKVRGQSQKRYKNLQSKLGHVPHQAISTGLLFGLAERDGRERTLKEIKPDDVMRNECGTYHFELGLGLLHKVILFRLSDAGEYAHLWVEVQHVAMEIC